MAPRTDMGGMLEEKMGQGKKTKEKRSGSEFHHLFCLVLILITFYSRYWNLYDDLCRCLSPREAPNLVRETITQGELESRHRKMVMGIYLWEERKLGIYFIKEKQCLDLKDDH